VIDREPMFEMRSVRMNGQPGSIRLGNKRVGAPGKPGAGEIAVDIDRKSRCPVTRFVLYDHNARARNELSSASATLPGSRSAEICIDDISGRSRWVREDINSGAVACRHRRPLFRGHVSPSRLTAVHRPASAGRTPWLTSRFGPIATASLSIVTTNS
jgi:hypothetical protein